MKVFCYLGRHGWEPHPDFDVLHSCFTDGEPAVRRCKDCGRVESRVYHADYWVRKEHLE